MPARRADPVALQRFLDRLEPGEPPEGQRYLRQAFAHYERRRHESDPRVRAQLAVLANLEVGFHEQTRLQPEIREALDAAYATKEDLGRRALEAVFPSAPRWWPVVRRPAAAVAGVVAAGTQRASSNLAREVITESFMVMSLPERVLALGAHLDDAYPDELREPSDAELTELIARFEPVPPDPDDCGARDWSVLEQRMHYIVHLFCAFHLREELSRPPFTPNRWRASAGASCPTASCDHRCSDGILRTMRKRVLALSLALASALAFGTSVLAEDVLRAETDDWILTAPGELGTQGRPRSARTRGSALSRRDREGGRPPADERREVHDDLADRRRPDLLWIDDRRRLARAVGLLAARRPRHPKLSRAPRSRRHLLRSARDHARAHVGELGIALAE